MQRVRAGNAYGLKAILDYIQNPAKTDDGLLVSAKDCLKECAYKQMMLAKHDHLQDSGRQYVHIIQSFSIDDKLTGQTAHQIGQKLLQNFEGFQGVVATHTDREHIHNHLVLNSVNWKTGAKWQQSKKDLQQLKGISDKLCLEHGLSVIKRGVGWKSYGENRACGQGVSWKEELAKNVADCINRSTSREGFLHKLDEYSIEAVFTKDSVLFITEDGHKCGSDKLTAYGDYSKENLENVIKCNGTALENGFASAAVMFEAAGIVAGLFDDSGGQYSQSSGWESKRNLLEGLTGEALKRAILEMQSSMKWGRNPPLPPKPSYYLQTVGVLLEVALDIWKQRRDDMERREQLERRSYSRHNEQSYMTQEEEEAEDEWEL